MAKPNLQPQPAVPVQPSQLPEPTNPIIEYLRNVLGAQFYRPNQDVPNQYGYYAGLANLPHDQGGMGGTNLESRPELYLGKKRPDYFGVAGQQQFDRQMADRPEWDRYVQGGLSTLEYPSNQIKTFVNNRGLDGVSPSPESIARLFSAIAHEAHHTDQYANLDPKNSAKSKWWRDVRPAAAPEERGLDRSFGTQQIGVYRNPYRDEAVISALRKASELGWPSLPKSGKITTENSEAYVPELFAEASGVEATQPRGRLPWDTEQGKQIFADDRMKGAYVEATRHDSPLATSALPETFQPDRNDPSPIKGRTMWNRLMSMPPVNKLF